MMRWRSGFLVGGLILVAGVAAFAPALVGGVIRSTASSPAAGLIVFGLIPMVAILGTDAFFLVRRARAGRPPFGPNFVPRVFARDLWLVLTCLYLPFLWVVMPLRWTPGTTDQLLGVPMLPGLGPALPFIFVLPQWTILNGGVMLLASSLLLMGLIRLTIWGWLGRACGLALLVAIPTSFLARDLASWSL